MRVVLAVLSLCVWILADTAHGAAAGSVDISTSASSLSSPSNVYGPWTFEDLDVQLPPDGEVGVHFENRRSADRFNSSTRQLLGLDASRAFSKAITLYAAASFGSGAPYARDRFTLETDVKVGRHWVPFIGGSLGSGYGIGATQQLDAGAFYYFGDDYASFRYMPSWSKLLGAAQGYTFALALGHPGRTTETFRAGTGGESDVSLITPLNPTLIGEREYTTSLSVKHWTGTARGYHIDLLYGTLDRTNAARIYSRISVGAGFFFALP
ncbi:MAG: YaiO family outer membrane beta-barrel protein [Candidatus Baltobacteraceae bacterium]